jgi:hypothetical protein
MADGSERSWSSAVWRQQRTAPSAAAGVADDKLQLQETAADILQAKAVDILHSR